jgi:hypothetical protein
MKMEFKIRIVIDVMICLIWSAIMSVTILEMSSSGQVIRAINIPGCPLNLTEFVSFLALPGDSR